MPRWNDNTDLYKVDRATDKQLRTLVKLRRANGSFYRGDFESLSKGTAGELIRRESSILSQTRKNEREYRQRNR